MEKSKTIKTVNILKTIMFAFSFCFAFLLLLCSINSNNAGLIICAIALFSFLPSIIVLFIYKYLKKENRTKKNKVISLIAAILLFLFLTAYCLFGLVMSVLIIGFDDLCFESNKAYRHSSNMSKLKYYTSEQEYYVSHFPKEIPKNAENYYFTYCCDLHGEGVHYLRFSTDKNYINQTIENNKNIAKKIPYSKINDYYRHLDNFDIENKEKYTAYILKKQNESDNKTSGIISSSNDIVFFYANFYVEQY